jgi:type IV secretory pathway VirB3-like protein
MIYILAVFVPPLALLLNGQPLSALINLIIIVPCIIFGLVFWVLFLIPSIHAVIAIAMKREQRRHREIVDAIERHGPPPGWPPR